jgi:hypothetical protein
MYLWNSLVLIQHVTFESSLLRPHAHTHTHTHTLTIVHIHVINAVSWQRRLTEDVRLLYTSQTVPLIHVMHVMHTSFVPGSLDGGSARRLVSACPHHSTNTE